MPTDYQQTLKQFLFDDNAVLDQLMDTLFDQINDAIRDGLSDLITDAGRQHIAGRQRAGQRLFPDGQDPRHAHLQR